MRKVFVVIALATAVCVAVWMFYMSPEAQVKRVVGASAKDSSSLVFRNLSKGRAEMYCGEVNGRNGFGAMGGFVRFVAHPNGMLFVDEALSDPDKAFDSIWVQFCK